MARSYFIYMHPSLLLFLSIRILEKERLQGEKFVNNYSDQKEAWAAFARVLFSSNEFLYVE